MADACLTAIGVPTSAEAVAGHYGARADGGLLDGWLVDEQDADAIDALAGIGIRTRAVPLWMSDVAATTRIAQHALDVAAQVRQ
jgi:LPPG:FO 2-phospho-L-lactate transferase